MKILLILGCLIPFPVAAQQTSRAISRQIQAEVTALEAKVCVDPAYKLSCDKENAWIAQRQKSASSVQAASLTKQINEDNKTLIAAIAADKKYAAASAHIKLLGQQMRALTEAKK